MKVFGMVSVRNDAHIIKDTLDNWGEICTEGIFCYGDFPQDATPALCRSHSAVVEYIDSTLYWEGKRAEMEPYKRQLLFNSLTRFCQLDDWVVMFDSDEHLELETFDKGVLEDPSIAAISPISWDMYMTEEDERDFTPGRGTDYLHRQYCSSDGPGVRCFPFFLRWDPRYRWWRPNQHFPDREKERGYTLVHGHVKHWSKGHSELIYDKKAHYYNTEWADTGLPGMESRFITGEGVRREKPYMDDNGHPLVKWEDRL